MPLLLKQLYSTQKLISDFNNLSFEQLITNPFFIEWVFCKRTAFNPVEINMESTQSHTLIRMAYDYVLKSKNSCRLFNDSLLQYRLMKGEFSSVSKEGLTPLEEVKLCYQVSYSYWMVIKEQLLNYKFELPEHEISFFKLMKPAFTAESVLFSLIYHAIEVSDKSTCDESNHFFEREKHRKERLLNLHWNFFSIYHRGLSERDQEWFTRTQDSDSSPGDHLVASLHALERYTRFINSNM